LNSIATSKSVGAIRKLVCGFLFAFHSNYGAARYSDLLVENGNFLYPTCI